MNVLFSIKLILLLTVAAILPAPNSPNKKVQRIVRLTDNSSGKIITIHTGTTIILKLYDQPDGGYVLDSVLYNKSVLRLTKFTKTSVLQTKMLGQPGIAIWKFFAFKGGNSVIKIKATRPWNSRDSLIVFKAILFIK